MNSFKVKKMFLPFCPLIDPHPNSQLSTPEFRLLISHNLHSPFLSGEEVRRGLTPDNVLDAIQSADPLKNIGWYGTGMTNAALVEYVGRVKQLQTLADLVNFADFSYNADISDLSPLDLVAKHISVMDVSGCFAVDWGTMPKWFPKMRHFKAEGTLIRGFPGFDEDQLVKLSVKDCPDLCWSTVPTKLPNLEVLRASRTKISSLAFLSHSSRLRTLEIEGCNELDWCTIPYDMKNVKTLRCTGCKFKSTAELAHVISRHFPNLKEIHLSSPLILLTGSSFLRSDLLRLSPTDAVKYLSEYTKASEPLTEVRIVMLGHGTAGKTTLKNSLKEEESDLSIADKSGVRLSRRLGEDDRTNGVDVKERWPIHSLCPDGAWKVEGAEPSIRILDFPGQSEFYSSNRLLLSSLERTISLVVCRLVPLSFDPEQQKKQGKSSVRESMDSQWVLNEAQLSFWLTMLDDMSRYEATESGTAIAPKSVHVVFTCADLCDLGYASQLIRAWREANETGLYKHLRISSISSVSGREIDSQPVAALRSAIVAEALETMEGARIPRPIYDAEKALLSEWRHLRLIATDSFRKMIAKAVGSETDVAVTNLVYESLRLSGLILPVESAGVTVVDPFWLSLIVNKVVCPVDLGGVPSKRGSPSHIILRSTLNEELGKLVSVLRHLYVKDDSSSSAGQTVASSESANLEYKPVKDADKQAAVEECLTFSRGEKKGDDEKSGELQSVDVHFEEGVERWSRGLFGFRQKFKVRFFVVISPGYIFTFEKEEAWRKMLSHLAAGKPPRSTLSLLHGRGVFRLTRDSLAVKAVDGNEYSLSVQELNGRPESLRLRLSPKQRDDIRSAIAASMPLTDSPSYAALSAIEAGPVVSSNNPPGGAYGNPPGAYGVVDQGPSGYGSLGLGGGPALIAPNRDYMGYASFGFDYEDLADEKEKEEEPKDHDRVDVICEVMQSIDVMFLLDASSSSPSSSSSSSALSPLSSRGAADNSTDRFLVPSRLVVDAPQGQRWEEQLKQYLDPSLHGEGGFVVNVVRFSSARSSPFPPALIGRLMYAFYEMPSLRTSGHVSSFKAYRRELQVSLSSDTRLLVRFAHNDTHFDVALVCPSLEEAEVDVPVVMRALVELLDGRCAAVSTARLPFSTAELCLRCVCATGASKLDLSPDESKLSGQEYEKDDEENLHCLHISAHDPETVERMASRSSLLRGCGEQLSPQDVILGKALSRREEAVRNRQRDRLYGWSEWIDHGSGSVLRLIPTDSIEDIKCINRGNFGVVFEGRYLGKHVAIKAPQRHVHGDELWREFSLWSSLPRHANICPLLGFCESFSYDVPSEEALSQDPEAKPVAYRRMNSRWAASGRRRKTLLDSQEERTGWYRMEAHDSLLLPFVGPSLLNFVHAKDTKPLDESTTLRLLMDVSRALALLHRERIVHRDVALRNVLVFEDGRRACLTDFGLSAKGKAKKREKKAVDASAVAGSDAVSSKEEMEQEDFSVPMVKGQMFPVKVLAPEVFLTKQYGPKADVFMFGWLAAHMLCPYADAPRWKESYSDAYDDYHVAVTDSAFLEKLRQDQLEVNFDHVMNKNHPFAEWFLPLLKDCTTEDPHERLSMKQVYERLRAQRAVVLGVSESDLEAALLESIS